MKAGEGTIVECDSIVVSNELHQHGRDQYHKTVTDEPCCSRISFWTGENVKTFQLERDFDIA